MLGADLNLSCIAVGSPMPHVKWMKDHVDLTPENEVPIGKNILQLKNIQQSANYTCVASSSLAQIEQTATVKVQCNYPLVRVFCSSENITLLQLCQPLPQMSPYPR